MIYTFKTPNWVQFLRDMEMGSVEFHDQTLGREFEATKHESVGLLDPRKGISYVSIDEAHLIHNRSRNGLELNCSIEGEHATDFAVLLRKNNNSLIGLLDPPETIELQGSGTGKQFVRFIDHFDKLMKKGYGLRPGKKPAVDIAFVNLTAQLTMYSDRIVLQSAGHLWYADRVAHLARKYKLLNKRKDRDDRP